MSDYLSADELADLIECKSNQRARMIAWLDDKRWPYVVGSNGLPKVARAYRDRKLGITEGKTKSKYAEAPNREAFA
jgi:hypothetical protein